MSNETVTWWIRGVAIVAFAAIVSALLILLLRPLLARYALAKPNARSSHTTPTPQGGGIAIVAATLIAAGAAFYFSDTASFFVWPPAVLFAAVIFIACVGAADDIKPIAVIPRLIMQTLIVGAVVLALPHGLRVLEFLPWWIERALLVIGGLWFVNLVNFMDGLDWMTVAEIVPVTAALALIGGLGGLPWLGIVLALSLCGAMVGFAYFNRPVAQLFLGDVGSLPIGLLMAWLLLLLAARGHLAAAILLPLYYLSDATITLFRRIFRGDAPWQAHRLHFYQLATDRGYTVLEVVGRVFVANILLAVLAVSAVRFPKYQIAALVIGATLVCSLLFIFARGKKAPSKTAF